MCSYNDGYFYNLYDSTEISQVDTRNAGEYGKEAEKANEAGMILFNFRYSMINEPNLLI